MPSSASNIDVFLRQDIYDSDIEHSALLNVWDDLSQASVEVTLANYPSFSEFVENNCLYCAAIQTWIPAEKEEDGSAAEQSHPPYSDHTFQPPQRQPSVPPPLLDHFETENPEDDFPTAWNTVPTPDAHLAPEQSWPPTPELDRKVSKKDSSRSDPLELKTIGLVFLTSQVASEISICVGLLPPYRGKGFGAEAVRLALQWAFDDIQCHRVQALLLDSPTRDRALRLFTTFGFAHEGTRRRAVMGARGWCDVTCMGMLDTEWLVRAGRSASGPRSMWDELFQRHQKEREELLRWEEMHRPLKRTASMETVRKAQQRTAVRVKLPQPAANPFADNAQPGGFRDDIPPRPPPSAPDMREMLFATRCPPGFSADSSDSEWDRASVASRVTPSSARLSRSPSPANSQNSEWALLETSSIASSNGLFWECDMMNCRNTRRVPSAGGHRISELAQVSISG